MKIAVVAEFFYPAIGGQEQRLLEFLEIISKQGHSIDVYTIRYLPELLAEEVYKNINIKRIYNAFNYRGGGGLKSRSIKTIIGYSFKIVSILKKQKYDKVIYTQFPILPIILSKIFLSFDKKVLDFVEFRESKFWRFIFGLESKCADSVACISKSVANKCSTITKKEKITVIPSSINLKKFENKTIKEDFIFIGRMEAHKHPEDAIKAVQQFNRKFNKNCKLHLIGAGTLLNTIKNKYGNDANIIFHGFITEKEKIKIIKKSSILIFPSEREGLPVSVVECMAAGVPVVTTDYPDNGTKDFVKDYEIGMVTEPIISKIVEGIVVVNKQIEYYKRNCKLSIEDFSAEKAAMKFLEL